jgi:hypothetical protein
MLSAKSEIRDSARIARRIYPTMPIHAGAIRAGPTRGSRRIITPEIISRNPPRRDGASDFKSDKTAIGIACFLVTRMPVHVREISGAQRVCLGDTLWSS